MDEYLGIVKLFAGTFVPKGWMACNGQLLSIAQNTALFSLLGTTYGGNGQTTFALPNLQGVSPIGMGTSKSGTTYVEGQAGGNESVTLTVQQIPAHNHAGGNLKVSSANASISTPTAGSSLATPGSIVNRQFTASLGYNTSAPDINLNAAITSGVTGGSQPVGIMQPYVAMYYIICVSGLFPSRE